MSVSCGLSLLLEAFGESIIPSNFAGSFGFLFQDRDLLLNLPADESQSECMGGILLCFSDKGPAWSWQTLQTRVIPSFLIVP